MIDLGIVNPGSTIRIPFSTFKGSDGSSLTMTNYAAADILIYKDGSTTERASTSGFTATTDFDSKTGKQLIVIDLSDNTTADFYAAGSEYLVAVDAVTVDAVTTGGWVARFRIGYEGAILNTTIATLSSQTGFTLTAGPADNSALVGCVALIHAAASGVQRAIGVVSAYTGSTKTVTLAADPAIFTMAAKDNISFFVPGNTKWFAQLATSKVPLAPATAGRDLVVDSAGLADSNVVKIGPTGNGVATTANLGTNLVLAFSTDFATLYDSTNKAFLSKLGNFAMGGASLTLTTGAISGTTLTLSGAVAFQSTFVVTGATTFTGAVTASNASNNIVGIDVAKLAGTAYASADFSATMKTSITVAVPTAAAIRAEMDANSAGLAAIYGKVDTEVATLQTTLDSLVVTVGVAGLGLSAIPKTGYKLASDGLDSISTTAPAGVASNFREMLVQVWRRFFKRVTKDSTQIKTYADDGTTVVTTQSYTSGSTDDVGAAS